MLDLDRLNDAVDELVGRLVFGPRLAQTLTKRLLNDGTISTLAEALDAEAAAQAVNLVSADAAEGYRTFNEKREPRFGRT